MLSFLAGASGAFVVVIHRPCYWAGIRFLYIYSTTEGFVIIGITTAQNPKMRFVSVPTTPPPCFVLPSAPAFPLLLSAAASAKIFGSILPLPSSEILLTVLALLGLFGNFPAVLFGFQAAEAGSTLAGVPNVEEVCCDDLLGGAACCCCCCC